MQVKRQFKRPSLLALGVGAILVFAMLIPAIGACSDDSAETGAADSGATIASVQDAAVQEVAVEGTTVQLGSCCYTELTAQQAKELIEADPNLVIIDVSSQYNEGHIPGAVNYPYTALKQVIPTMDPDASYLIYCHSCCTVSEDTLANLEKACPGAPEGAIAMAVSLGNAYRTANQVSPGTCLDLAQAGFSKVYRLTGNLGAWIDAGYAISY